MQGIRRTDFEVLQKMMGVMKYRGPDDEGTYRSGKVALGHKRLSIIDLNTGKQPIANEDETVWVVFNGEIYNFASLSENLLKHGHIFRTKTDTEVLVHGYEQYGTEILNRLRGMFSFAIWDCRRETLFLARDRIGIKPLYYTSTGNTLVFASEIKAILQEHDIKAEVNLPCIDRFLSYNYLPGSETLHKNIYKLLPGHYLIWENGRYLTKRYWNLDYVVHDKPHSLHESAEKLHAHLREAVKIHMISDVPVGFLLSGGVDSTALLSLAIQETDKDISTFTVGFSGEKFADERKYARLAANAFGTKQYDLTITADDFGNFLPKYIWHMEEPICEPPAVALYYISKLASEHVKVLISGEGGDEAFAGYPNYRNYFWLERLKSLLGPLNSMMPYIVEALSHAPGLHKMKKFAPLFTVPLDEYYLSRTSSPFTFFNKCYASAYTDEYNKIINKRESTMPTARLVEQCTVEDDLGKMLHIDTMTWLPDDLLIKADRMTMANSVELRVPLLDHEVLEFAANLPSSYKLHGFATKYILKEAFRKIVPQEILDQKKTGFPVPYENWMRGDLRQLVEDTLLSKKALERGYFQRRAIEKMLFLNLNEGSYAKEVFSLLILELWHREFIDGTAVS